MGARCRAVVEEDPGFDVVTLTWVVPADAPAIENPRYLFEIYPPPNGIAEAGRLVLVVTNDAVRFALGPESVSRRTGSDKTVGFSYRNGMWIESGSGPCLGATSYGQDIEFIAACPA